MGGKMYIKAIKLYLYMFGVVMTMKAPNHNKNGKILKNYSK